MYMRFYNEVKMYMYLLLFNHKLITVSEGMKTQRLFCYLYK